MKSAATEREGLRIGAIYRTSTMVYAVAACYVVGYWGGAAWLGLTAGVALALGSLRLIEWSVQGFTAAARRAGSASRAAARGIGSLLGVGKYLLLAPVIAGVVRAAEAGHLNLIAFVGGILLVHAVILLQAVGAWLVERQAAGGSEGSDPPSVKIRGGLR